MPDQDLAWDDVTMSNGFEAYKRSKQLRACFHEAGHIRVTLELVPDATIDALVDGCGGGDSFTVFPKGTAREIKLQAAVAGFLAEAKGFSGKELSRDRDYVRMVAADLDRRLRAGETKIPITVLMVDGDEVPAATNSADFAFLLEELKEKKTSLRDFLTAMDPWANDIENAMRECIERLEDPAFWRHVQDTANHLCEQGWLPMASSVWTVWDGFGNPPFAYGIHGLPVVAHFLPPVLLEFSRL